MARPRSSAGTATACQASSLRRNMPARPTRPEPSSNREDGSGVAAENSISPLYGVQPVSWRNVPTPPAPPSVYHEAVDVSQYAVSGSGLLPTVGSVVDSPKFKLSYGPGTPVGFWP